MVDKQLEYNMRDGLSLQIHDYIYERLKNKINPELNDIEMSNQLLDWCDDSISELHDSIDASIEMLKENYPKMFVISEKADE